MVNINDYNDLKIGDHIIIIDSTLEEGEYENIYTLIGIIGQQVHFSSIGGFSLNSIFSQKCFMYFREKNLNEILNK
jgi:hypothetical protein